MLSNIIMNLKGEIEVAEVYAVSIQKGGVGKTSLITNLAALLAHDNKKVLLVDTDSQGNASMSFGLMPDSFKNTIYDVMTGEIQAREAIVNLAPNLDLLPSNDDLSFIDFDILTDLKTYPEPYQLIKKGLESIQDDYDYILIDSPPSITLVTGNVLAVADKVIIPFMPEPFGVQGLIRIVRAVNEFKEKENPKLSISGIVGMMIDSRTILHKQIMEQAQAYADSVGLKIFENTIPKSIRYSNSIAFENRPSSMADNYKTVEKPYYKLKGEIFNG